jgi:hypothetical protein
LFSRIGKKYIAIIICFYYHKTKKPSIIVPLAQLPTSIINIDFKPGSSNTVELYLDAGWQFSFRIHNASTYVEPSLKFDIQIIGMPATVILINSEWKKSK